MCSVTVGLLSFAGSLTLGSGSLALGQHNSILHNTTLNPTYQTILYYYII